MSGDIVLALQSCMFTIGGRKWAVSILGFAGLTEGRD